MRKIVSAICMFFAAMQVMAAANHVKSVTAIGEVLGDGAKTTAVAIEYDAPISGSSLSTASYTVDGRTVKRVYTNSETAELLAKGGNIHYFHLTSGSHFDTWRVAYGFSAVRDWLFEQKK